MGRSAAIGLWLALLVFFIYLLSYAGVLHAIDEQSALSVAESMLLGQGFHTNQMAWDQARTPPQNAAGLDGNLYSKKGIGVSVAVLPLFWLGKQVDGVGAVQLALLAGTLAIVLAVWVFYRLGLALEYPVRVAAAGALVLGLATPLWPYARTILSEGLAAGGLALALWGAVAWRHGVNRSAPQLRWLWLAGAGLALLILMKSSNAVVVPVFGVYLLWNWFGEQKLGRHPSQWLGAMVAIGVPVVLAVGATVAYNFVRFGTLASFPLEPYERFSTPLAVGLAGLLISAGKGILWYMPVLWLVPFFVLHWRRERRLPDFLLALGAAAGIIVLYALWYDWPGGRAWGPRMIVVAVPALAMLVLPALGWLLAQTRLTWRSALTAGVILLSVIVQLPGVLVNFERQEGLDMQSGATFDQLLWELAHAPLLTYWTKIGSAPDPLWLQPYMTTLPGWQMALAVGAALVTGAALIAAGRNLRRNRGAAVWLLIAALGCLGLAGTLVAMAAPDPRWDELSAVREENAALLSIVARQAQPHDLVLIDLLPSTDKEHRTGLWLNQAPLQPYIGWLRSAALTDDAGERLRRWLAPYRRVWLLLQATDEGDPASSTEQWLDGWAFPGRRAWVGSQRYVEYIAPPADAQAVPMPGPYVFGAGEDAVALASYTVVRDALTADAAVTLAWPEASLPPQLRYSLQALDPAGQLVAQVDGVPGRLPAANGATDRIGLALPAGDHALILKVYRAGDGGVLLVQTPGGSEPLPYLTLQTD